MKTTLLLALTVLGTASAQRAPPSIAFPAAPFTGISTNHDGSSLLFASPLRLKGSVDQVGWEKIFAWTAETGVRLHAQFQHPTFRRAHLTQRWESDDYYHLNWPAQSSTGNVVAYTGQRDCSGGNICTSFTELWQTTVRFADGPERTFPGSAQLSANGNFALIRSSRLLGIGPAPDVTWTNTRTGQVVTASSLDLPAGGSRPVADNGATLRYSDRNRNVLEIWRPGFSPLQQTEVKSLPQWTGITGQPLLSSDANVVITATEAGVFAYDVSTGVTQRLLNNGIPIDVSADGSVVLISNPFSGLWIVVNRGNASLRIVPSLDHTVTEAVLSGNGGVVFATSADGRVVRVALESSAVTEVVPKTAYARLYWLDGRSANVARGTLMRLRNTAANNRPMPLEPLPGGPPVAARYLDQSWPVIASGPQTTAVQVPWEAPSNSSEKVRPDFVHVVLPPSSQSHPFDAAWLAPLIHATEVSPVWILNEDEPPGMTVLAAHQDFRSLVTTSSPARPGEIIHAYATGFGPVSPSVETGQPSRVDQLFSITEPLECTLGGAGAQPVEVLFAGLAPGLVGLYQIDIKMPESVPEQRPVFLTCRTGTFSATADLPVR